MSVFDIDVAARRNPEVVRSKEFATARRGYDPAQVQDYLNQVAGWIDQLERELRQARTELSTMSRKRVQTERAGDPYERLGSRVADIVRAAEQAAEEIRKEAEEETGSRLGQAKDQADRQLQEAKSEAERLLTEARIEAEKVKIDANNEAQRLRVAADQAIQQARQEAEGLLASLTELHTYRERLKGLVGQLEPVMKPPSRSEDVPSGTPPASGQEGESSSPASPVTEPFDRQRFEELVGGKDRPEGPGS